MKQSVLSVLCLFIIMLGLAPFVSSAQEKTFPDRPLTIVVGFGVGGSVDQMARTLAPFLSKELGQPVQVVNKKGAGTLLAANYVLSKPDDGYTIFASGFNPYLTNTILEGNADYTLDDFSFINFQWYAQDFIAVNKESKFTSLDQLMNEIKAHPKTVRASVVRGSSGHLMAKLLLELYGIPQDNLNLVTYNGGGPARTAVAGGVVDFTIISATGTESVQEYIRPIAIVSEKDNEYWQAPAINSALADTGITAPILKGTIRGFATSSSTKKKHPVRFNIVAQAMKRALNNPDFLEQISQSQIETTWTGPDESDQIMKTNFDVFKQYSYLLKL